MKTICEVGVNIPKLSKALKLAHDYDAVILVEPEPYCYDEIIKHLNSSQKLKNKTKVYRVAITETAGIFKMIQSGSGCQSSCLDVIPNTPIKTKNTKNLKDLLVIGDTFDKIDDGKIDTLYIDAEGAEWFVLKNMISRPKTISIELGNHSNTKYINPFFKEIIEWLNDNGYVELNRIESDRIYERLDK